MPSVYQPQLVTLGPSSSTFCQLEYTLQSLAKASTLRIKRASELIHPTLRNSFENKSKNVSVLLESWIPASRLMASKFTKNFEDELIKNSFQIQESTPSQPLGFPIGAIKLQEILEVCDNGKYAGKLAMCKIAVGRSFCCANMQEAQTMELPESYNSFFIDDSLSTDPPNSFSFCSEKSLPNKIDFVLKDSQLILPVFIVDVEWDPQAEKQSRQRLTCDNCERVEAVRYCQSDSAYLCESCDKEIHISKLASRHTRVPLEKGLHCVVHCRLHPERLAEFFCPTCHVVVCLSCKMIGHHSNGEAADHALVSVPDAYSSVMGASTGSDPIIEERRKSIISQLNRVQAKAGVVLSNVSQIREKLVAIHNAALSELEAHVSKKLRVLRGDASLFRRLLQALQQTSDYLDYLKTGRDAPLFLLSWHHYLQAKVAISIVPAAHSSAIAKPTDPTLCPDTLLGLVGSLNIVPMSNFNASSISLLPTKLSNSLNSQEVSNVTEN